MPTIPHSRWRKHSKRQHWEPLQSLKPRISLVRMSSGRPTGRLRTTSWGLYFHTRPFPVSQDPFFLLTRTRSAWNSAGGALLSWQPFDFGARGAKVEVARQGSEAAKQAASLTRLEVSVNAGIAFFDVAAAEQLVTVAQANVHRYESFAKVVHVLVDNSLRPGADASQADAQLALASNQLIQAQTEATLRRSALAEYLQIVQTVKQ